MAGPGAKSKKPSGKKFAKPSVTKKTSRDVVQRPTVKEIQESIERGVTKPLSDFRKIIGW